MMKARYFILSLILFAFIFSCKEEAKVLRIGALIPQSGTLEPYGRNVKNGLTLALNQINDMGGVGGKKLDLIFEDDGSDEKVAVRKAEQLVKQVPVIIGGVTSPVALAIAPVCESSKVVLLSPTASSPKFSEAGNYIFRNYPSDSLEGRVMANYAVRRMKIKSVDILSIDNEYGQGLRDVFKSTFTGLGGQILAERSFAQGQTDFKDLVKEVKTTSPDAVYIIGYYNEIAGLVQELKKQKVESKIISVEGVAQPIILEIASEAAEGLVYPQPPYSPDSSEPAIQKFVSSYKAKFGTKPDIDAAFSYDALRIVAKAIEKCQNYPTDFRDRLADTNMKGLIGDISFDSNGDVDITPRMFQIHEGKFVPLE
jgi:branched-chain amino acid transport system substrate-binding protein